MIHIRIQQRNGRKTLTSVQGLSEEYDLNHGLNILVKRCYRNKTEIKWRHWILVLFLLEREKSREKSRVYFFKEKLSKCVSVTLLVTVLLSNILNMVKLSSFKVFAFI